jgi:hypothetical protein
MISLTNQLVEQLNEVFSGRNDTYKDTLIKEAYKDIPKGKYPKIIIEEINNSEVFSRVTNQGERTTALSYQITCYSRDTEEYDYVDSVKFMMDIVDDFISQNYAMRRLGSRAVKPYITDNTIMTCIQRYDCVYDRDMQLIYKN